MTEKKGKFRSRSNCEAYFQVNYTLVKFSICKLSRGYFFKISFTRNTFLGYIKMRHELRHRSWEVRTKANIIILRQSMVANPQGILDLRVNLKLGYELKLCHTLPLKVKDVIATKKKHCLSPIFAYMNNHIHSHCTD